MKDFAKKIISAAAALTMAASMSVYAEETVPVESVNDSAPAVIAMDAVNTMNAVGCVNHVTFRIDEYLGEVSILDKHNVPGKGICNTQKYIYGYDLICMKCGETVGHVQTRMVVTHSIVH